MSAPSLFQAIKALLQEKAPAARPCRLHKRAPVLTTPTAGDGDLIGVRVGCPNWFCSHAVSWRHPEAIVVDHGEALALLAEAADKAVALWNDTHGEVQG